MLELKKRIGKTRFFRKMIENKGKIVCQVDQCIYCGMCEKSCPVNAIKVIKTSNSWNINHEVCVRCEHCIRNCPQKVLSLSKSK